MTDRFIYALEERIGEPTLFTGRQKELNQCLEWAYKIEKKMARSMAILSRRKSGKTTLLQRFYNTIWNKNGKLIPFYIEMEDKPTWLKDFCREYYLTFLSQYYSFKLREPRFASNNLFFDEIKEIAVKRDDKYIINSIKEFEYLFEVPLLDNLFSHVTKLPNALAIATGDFFVVMIDEFQYMNKYIFRDEACINQAKGIVGGYHALSESRVAPMCVAGSYVGWLRELISEKFKGGRLREWPLNPRLTPEEGLECVFKYSELTGQAVSMSSAVAMNELTGSDPFYISSIFESGIDNKNLATPEGVVKAFSYEILDRGSELNKVWAEYILSTIKKINDLHARKIVMFLSMNRKQEWSREEIKNQLKLEMSEGELHTKLKMLVRGDLIGQGSTEYRYRGISDDIFDLLFRSIYQDEIDHFKPDIEKELTDTLEKSEMVRKIRSLTGKIGEMQGRAAEYFISQELKYKTKRRPLSERVHNWIAGAVFEDYQAVYTRYRLSAENVRDYEFDIYAEKPDGLSLVFEIKNREKAVDADVVRDFLLKLTQLRSRLSEDRVAPVGNTELAGIIVSRSGFTNQARVLMTEEEIMYADFRHWFGE